MKRNQWTGSYLDNFFISVKHEVQVCTLKQNNIQSLFFTDINLWLLGAQNLKFF